MHEIWRYSCVSLKPTFSGLHLGSGVSKGLLTYVNKPLVSLGSQKYYELFLSWLCSGLQISQEPRAPLNAPAAPSTFCREPKYVLFDIQNTFMKLMEKHFQGLPGKNLNFRACCWFGDHYILASKSFHSEITRAIRELFSTERGRRNHQMRHMTLISAVIDNGKFKLRMIRNQDIHSFWCTTVPLRCTFGNVCFFADWAQFQVEVTEDKRCEWNYQEGWLMEERIIRTSGGRMTLFTATEGEPLVQLINCWLIYLITCISFELWSFRNIGQ